MDERRRQMRYPTVFQSELIDLASGEVIGNLADISSGGMMIRCEPRLAAGQRLRLKVELPARQADGVEARVETEVRWCQPDLEPNSHVVGLAFTGATPPGGALVQELVRVLKDAS
jgi:c-di-GMP-binding flagellar brake protein YcgR